MGVLDKMKAAAQAVSDKAKEWVDAGVDKLKESLDALVAAAPELVKVGYRLTDLELEMALTPRVIVLLQRDREAGEEEFQALLANHHEGGAFTTLVKGLRHANAMDRRLRPQGRVLAGVRFELGLPPVFSLRYSEPATPVLVVASEEHHEDY